MNWFNRLVGGGAAAATTRLPTAATTTAATTAATVNAPKQASPTAPANSPLKPGFERGQAKFKGQVQAAMDESQGLAEGFKACLMEVGVANAKGAPRFYGYGTHKPMTMSLTKPLPDGRLDLTVCLNVSGHDLKDLPNKQQALQDRANDNRYVIQVTHPDGTVDKMTGIEARGALSTAQDISIKNLKAGTTIVEAWPEHSAGVGGYIEGRRLEISYAPPGAPGGGDSFG